MKNLLFFTFLISFALTLTTFGQAPEQVLATAGTQKFTVAELSPEIAMEYVGLSKTIADLRVTLFDAQVADVVFELEAKSKGVTPAKLVDQIRSTVPDPTAVEIKAVFDANRVAIGERTLEQVRPQIVKLLREEPEQKALVATFNILKTKFKIIRGKDVNSLSLRPADVLATVGTKTITSQEFEESNRIILYETKAKVFDKLKFALNELIFNAVLSAEAKSLNIESSDLMAREITDKLREYSDDERNSLETALRKRLYAKYKVQILVKEPAAPVFTIATENAPSKGPATAPVTVVMFSDFQCPACAVVHPLLKKVIAEYGDKVRFAIRNFPLTSIHENAFLAAVAANAAQSQGKYFEFSELLYRNQTALDADSLKKYAAETGLNMPQFELDLQSERLAEKVRKDMADGRSYGVMSTPTVFVNGSKIRIITADGFREAIEKVLGK